MKSGQLNNQRALDQVINSTINTPSQLKKFPNASKLTKELEKVLNEFDANTVGDHEKKIIPQLVKIFAGTERDKYGVTIGYNCAYYDAFKDLEGTPARITNSILFEQLGIQERIIAHLLTYAKD